MIADRYAESMAGLLPKGFAWPRDPGSVLMRHMHGLGAALAEAHELLELQVEQWQPATTTRLSEWEASCGLPDPCFGDDQDEPTRRLALLRRLRGPVLPLDDSSPASPTVIEQIGAELGYDITVRYNHPFRVGRDRVGDSLGVLDGRLHITVDASGSEPFRAGVSRVGDRLIERPGIGTDLECYLRRVLPARFESTFIYE